MRLLPWGNKKDQSSSNKVQAVQLLPWKQEPPHKPSPPPPVLQKHAREQINRLPAVREPVLPVFPGGAHAMAGYGEVLARVDTSPQAIEIFIVNCACSHFRRPFTMLYGKTAIGMPYRLMLSGSLHEAQTMLNDAARSGAALHPARDGSLDFHDFEWSNWQCLGCGRGKVHGDIDTWWWCSVSSTINCSASMIYPRNGARTALCVTCNVIYPITAQCITLNGRKQLLESRRY